MPFPFSVLLLLTLLFASNHFDQILFQFSQAMAQAINTSHPLCNLLPGLLEHLCNSRSQSKQLTEMAYGWCSLICENHSTVEDAEDLLLLSLELGFHHIDPRERRIEAKLIHTENHQKLASIVFSSRKDRAIADLLCSWTSRSDFHAPYPQLEICAEHLISLHCLHPFSSRLRLHIIDAIECIGYQEFEQVGTEEFVRLLNNLQVCAGGPVNGSKWSKILLDTIKLSKGIQHLSHQYWKWLVEYAAYWPDGLKTHAYSPHSMASLVDAKEWDKLRCWITIVWLVWPPEGGKTTEEDLENAMFLLFHQQPSALQELEEEMKQWSKKWSRIQIPKSFEQICKKAYDKIAQQVTL